MQKLLQKPRSLLFGASRILLLLLALSMFQSCKVSLIAAQDPGIVAQIDSVSRKVDTFYLQMMENPTLPYSAYSPGYIDIEVELNSIYDQSRLKAKNTETATIAKNVRDTWAKYKSEHKADGTINPGVITYNHMTMDDFLFALSVAENSKPK